MYSVVLMSLASLSSPNLNIDLAANRKPIASYTSNHMKVRIKNLSRHPIHAPAFLRP